MSPVRTENEVGGRFDSLDMQPAIRPYDTIMPSQGGDALTRSASRPRINMKLDLSKILEDREK